jgi:hypothetical protein
VQCQEVVSRGYDQRLYDSWARLPVVHSEMLEEGDDIVGGVGINVRVTGNQATCTGKARDGVLTCQVRGPATVAYEVQDWGRTYSVPAGRIATWRYNSVLDYEQRTTCLLNAQ